MNRWEDKKNYIKNLIYFSILASLCIVFMVVGSMRLALTAIALEQETVCGITEHVHNEDCFNEAGILDCEKTEHTHNDDCYLILLKDNDINELLTEIDETEEHSLDCVVSEAVDSAVNTIILGSYKENADSDGSSDTGSSEINASDVSENGSESSNSSSSFDTSTVSDTGADVKSGSDANTENEKSESVDESSTSVSDDNDISAETNDKTDDDNTEYTNEDLKLNSDTIPIINEAISSDDGTANITLNEDVNIAIEDGEDEEEETDEDIVVVFDDNSEATASPEETDDPDAIALLALDDSVSVVSNAAIIYVYLDGEWTLIGSASISTTRQGQDNYYTVSGSNISSLIYDELGLNYTYYSGYRVRYSTSENGNYSSVSGNNNNIQLGKANGGGPPGTSTDYTRYIRIYDSSNSSPLAFYTVTYEYLDGTTEKIYVPSGSTISLPSDADEWSDGTDTIIEPSTTLDWDTLKSYASGSKLTLTGVWDYGYTSTVNFFIRYDSVAVDTEGNIDPDGYSANLYTSNLFTSYVFNGTATSYTIADTTSDNSYQADQEIRALVNESDTNPWLMEFPDDDYIFEELNEYAVSGKLEVDGVLVDPDELNSTGYAIRWYVFKYQNTWHIDGKLVRKTGEIDVYKTFEGTEEAVAEAKKNFSIYAESVEDSTKYYTLTTSNYDTYDGDYDSSTDTYHWVIPDVKYLEQWKVSELNADVSGYNRHSEYAIIDASGTESRIGTGSSVSLSGMTYATDTTYDESLEVHFTNLYTSTETMVIKKVDSATGNALGGAAFTFVQNASDLSFTYDVDAGVYIQSSSGDIDVIAILDSGYAELSLELDNGDITITEIVTPTGYVTPTAPVVLGYDTGGELTVLSGDAEYDADGGVLTIYNTPLATALTVTKSWLSSSTANVTMQLLADGRSASAVFPNLSITSEVTLTSLISYKYTWYGLPLYADGELIDWSVLETKIGSEKINDDGTFDNWLTYYSYPSYTYDSSGNISHIYLGVTNDVRRVMLRITKRDGDTLELLSGAEFTLQLVNDDGTIDDTFTALTATTGTDGTLIFDDIPYGKYLVTETIPPDGYSDITETIYITINTDDSLTIGGTYPYVDIDSGGSYSVIIDNFEAAVLPATGGNRIIYTQVGVVILVASALIYILFKKRGYI